MNVGKCRSYAIGLCCFFLATACTTIATFDQVAYDQANGAKAEALALIDKATNSYGAHLKEIDAVSLAIDKAYEYDRAGALNTITVQPWEILRGLDRTVLDKVGFTKGSVWPAGLHPRSFASDNEMT